MGSLALWGAIGGAAKGAEKHLLQRQQDESYAKRSNIDEARENRLEGLRQTNRVSIKGIEAKSAMDLQGASDTAAMSRLERTGELAESQEEFRQFGQEQMKIIEQQHDSIERELDRKHDISKARISASSSGSNPFVKAYLDRYEKVTLTDEQYNEYGIAQSARQLPLTYDKMSGKYYVQQGDKVFYADKELPDLSNQDPEQGPVYPKPQQANFEALAQNPARYEGTFVNSFGYLPGWFLTAKMNAEMRTVAGAGQGAQ